MVPKTPRGVAAVVSKNLKLGPETVDQATQVHLWFTVIPTVGMVIVTFGVPTLTSEAMVVVLPHIGAP